MRIFFVLMKILYSAVLKLFF